MDGIRINEDVTLYLMEIPDAKGLAFTFYDGLTYRPVAYVPERNDKVAREYWQRFLNGDTAQVVK